MIIAVPSKVYIMRPKKNSASAAGQAAIEYIRGIK